jgi:MYXO-CTERM domain-containing protein
MRMKRLLRTVIAPLCSVTLACTGRHGSDAAPLARDVARVVGEPQVSASFPLVPPAYVLDTNNSPSAGVLSHSDQDHLLVFLVQIDPGYTMFAMRVSASTREVRDPRGIAIAGGLSLDRPRVVSTGTGWLFGYADKTRALFADGTLGPEHDVPVRAGDLIWGEGHALLTRGTTGLFVDAGGEPEGAPFTTLALPPGSSIWDWDQGSYVDGRFILPYTVGTPTPTTYTTYGVSVTNSGEISPSTAIYSWPLRERGKMIMVGKVATFEGPAITCSLGGRCGPYIHWCQPLTLGQQGEPAPVGAPVPNCTLYPEGTSGDLAAIRIEVPQPQTNPALAADSEGYVATWFDPARGGLVAAQLSSVGVPKSDEPVLFAAGARQSVNASNGARTLLTWDAPSALEAALFMEDGAVMPVPLGGIPPNEFRSLASNGTDFLLTWSAARDPSLPEEYLHVVNVASNGVLGGSVDVATNNPAGIVGAAEAPSVAFDGENYVVVWGAYATTDDHIIQAVRITPDLRVLDTPPKILLHNHATARSPASTLVASRSGVLLIWADAVGDDQSDWRCSRLDRDLTLANAAPPPWGTFYSVPGSAQAAWDGEQYWLVLYAYSLAEKRAQLRGIRVAEDGIPRDAEPFLIVAAGDVDLYNYAFSAAPTARPLVVHREPFYAGLVGRVLSDSGDVGSGGGGGTLGLGGAAGIAGSGVAGSASADAGAAAASSGEGGEAGTGVGVGGDAAFGGGGATGGGGLAGAAPHSGGGTSGEPAGGGATGATGGGLMLGGYGGVDATGGTYATGGTGVTAGVGGVDVGAGGGVFLGGGGGDFGSGGVSAAGGWTSGAGAAGGSAPSNAGEAGHSAAENAGEAGHSAAENAGEGGAPEFPSGAAGQQSFGGGAGKHEGAAAKAGGGADLGQSGRSSSESGAAGGGGRDGERPHGGYGGGGAPAAGANQPSNPVGCNCSTPARTPSTPGWLLSIVVAATLRRRRAANRGELSR